MIRLLCALGALLVLLVLGESTLREHQHAVRRTAGTLRLLAPEPASAIAQIEVRAAGRRWHYVRRGTLGISQRITALLSSTAVSSTCSRVCSLRQQPSSRPSLGTWPAMASARVVSASICSTNRAIPCWKCAKGAVPPGHVLGNRMSSAWVPTAFSISTPTPVHALDTAPPAPMLDRRVLPQALQRKGLRRIAFASDPSYPVQSLSHQLKAMTAPTPMMPTYEWVAFSAAGAETCLSASVETYADFLKRLTWSALHDPGQTDAFAQARYLYLEDEEGTIDTLAIGAADDQGRYPPPPHHRPRLLHNARKSPAPLPHSIRPPRHAPSTLALPPSRALDGREKIKRDGAQTPRPISGATAPLNSKMGLKLRPILLRSVLKTRVSVSHSAQSI